MNPDGRRRIPDIKLEQYLLGELPANEMAETKRILEGDEEARGRLAALEQSNREILEQYPADVASRRIQSRLEPIRQPRQRFLRPLPVSAFMGAAAVLLLLWVALPEGFITSESGGETPAERVKGQGPHLKLYRKAPKMLHIDRLYETYPEILCDAMDRVYRIDGVPKEKLTKLFLGKAKQRVTTRELLSDAFTAWRSV